jgi:hypothetical protein
MLMFDVGLGLMMSSGPRAFSQSHVVLVFQGESKAFNRQRNTNPYL